MAFWSTKAAISLKHAKIEKKLLSGAYRNSPTLLWTVPLPTPYGLHSPRLGFAPHPKLQSLLSQERVKLRTSNLASTFRGSIRAKAHEKFWRKGSVGISEQNPIKNFREKGISRDCQIFSGTPYYLRNEKSYGFQIWLVHWEGPSEQKSFKNLEKGSVG